MIKPTRRPGICGALSMIALGWFAIPSPVLAGAPDLVEPINLVKGTVVDHEGNPVAGAKVAAANDRLGYIMYSGGDDLYVYGGNKRVLLLFTARNGSASAETVTAEDGSFTLSNLMSGATDLIAVHAKHGIWFLENFEVNKDCKPLDVALQKPRFVEGRIRGLSKLVGKRRLIGPTTIGRLSPAVPLSSETSNAGIMSIAFNPMARVDANGQFRAGPIPNQINDWSLAFTRRVPNYTANILQTPITLSPDGTSKFELDLNEGHKLDGTVLGPEGKPLRNVSVTAQRSDGVVVGAVTNSKGHYEITGVTEGSVKLAATRWIKRTSPG